MLVWIIIGAVFGALGRGVIGAVIVGAMGGLLGYTLLPTLNYGYTSGLVVAGLCALASIGLLFTRRDDAAQRILIGIAVTAVAVLFGVTVHTVSLFHASTYQRALNIQDTTTNTPDLEVLDPSRVRIVTTQALAQRMAESVLGENGALGSQVQVGEMTLQVVNNEWVWVGALNHSSFLRWAANDATPGYVTVSATRLDGPNVARLVLERNKEPMALVYNEGAYFGQDVERHFYAAAPTVGRVAPHFEVDDTGAPFWVSATYEPVQGFGGYRVTGGLIMDAQTGVVTRCVLRDCPAWIDVLHSRNVVASQIDDWGEFAEGWFNPSGKNKLAATSGMGRVIDKKGQQYYYTGIMSVNADQGTTGYMLVNTRTGEARYFRQAGVTEGAAMAAAAGAVQEKEYEADYPTPYTVGTTWSYFIPLHDRSGWPKGYAFVAVHNAQIFGVGTTPTEALRAYRQRLVGETSLAADPAASKPVRLTGVIERFEADIRNGQASYFFALRGTDDRLFVGSSVVSPVLPLTQVGDTVTLEFFETGDGVIDIIRFEHGRYKLRGRSVAPDSTPAPQTPASADTATADTATVKSGE